MNVAEAINSAGGVIVGDDGKPNVNTPEATKGLGTLVDWFKDGTIPKGAITWQEEDGRRAFQAGELVFHRNWGYVYNHGQQDRRFVEGRRQVRDRPAAGHQQWSPASRASVVTASASRRTARTRGPRSTSSSS